MVPRSRAKPRRNDANLSNASSSHDGPSKLHQWNESVTRRIGQEPEQIPGFVIILFSNDQVLQ